jgi:glycosyltransferase involved in cell wall biosynthesis
MRSFVDGLSERYAFVLHYANRKYGGRRRALLRPVNAWYLVKHFLLWIAKLVWHRPAAAHYPITSYWNIDKSLFFLTCALLCGARPIGHLHGGAFLDSWNVLPPLRKKLAQSAMDRLEVFVVLSQGWKERICAAGVISEERVMVVHNPIERSFEGAALALPTGRDTRRVLFLGALAKAKGVLDLLEASGRFLGPAAYELDLVGPEREPGIAAQCHEVIGRNSLQGRVHVQEAGVWGSDKIGLYARAAIFVLPSYFENLPLVVLEAAAAGLPIVATRVGALPEAFVHEESILYVDPGDVEGLFSALARLGADGPLRQRLGEAARNVFRTSFSRDAIMYAMDGVYQRALSDRS